MRRWLTFSVLFFIQFVSAQEKDSSSIKEIAKALFGIDEPRVGMVAQFDGEWLTSHLAPKTSFNVHLLRLYLSGTIDDKWKFLYQGDLNGSYRTLDAKLSYLFDHHWKIDAGQFKVAFGREFLRNDAKLLFVNRSTVANRIGPLRQLGIQVTGNWFDKRLMMNTGVFNGEGAYSGDNISMVVANVNIIPILHDEDEHQRLEMGGSLAYASDEYDLYNLSYADNKLLWSGNLRLEYEDYWVEAECNGFYHSSYNWQEGFYVDLARHLSARLEGALRFNWYRDDGDPNFFSFYSYPRIDRAYLAGLNWYPEKNIKIQFNVIRYQSPEATQGIINLQYAVNNEF